MLFACAADSPFPPPPPLGMALLGLSCLLAALFPVRRNTRYQGPRDSPRSTAWRPSPSAVASLARMASSYSHPSLEVRAQHTTALLILHVAAGIKHIR